VTDALRKVFTSFCLVIGLEKPLAMVEGATTCDFNSPQISNFEACFEEFRIIPCWSVGRSRGGNVFVFVEKSSTFS